MIFPHLRSVVTDDTIESMRTRNEYFARRSIINLGAKWVLAKPVARLAAPSVRVLDRHWGRV